MDDWLLNAGDIVRIEYSDDWERCNILEGRYFLIRSQPKSVVDSIYKGSAVFYGFNLVCPVMFEHLVWIPVEEQELVRAAMEDSERYQLLHHLGVKIGENIEAIHTLMSEVDHEARIWFYRSADELITDLKATEDDALDDIDKMYAEIKRLWEAIINDVDRLSALEKSFFRANI